jgi:hypothetical protein
MSLVICSNSAIFRWYSALTVYSSSLTECSSSFVLCSSSFDATISSFVACSSSLLVSSSSMVACRFSFVYRNSCSSDSKCSRDASPMSISSIAGPDAALAPTDSNVTKLYCMPVLSSSNGSTETFNCSSVSWKWTRTHLYTTACLRVAARCNAPASGVRRSSCSRSRTSTLCRPSRIAR